MVSRSPYKVRLFEETHTNDHIARHRESRSHPLLLHRQLTLDQRRPFIQPLGRPTLRRARARSVPAYGIGSALAEEPIGLVLGVANSIAVIIIGVIGLRLLRNHHPRAGALYLATRVAEAILLAGGIALHTVADVADADNTGYLLGMVALGIGSLPFWHVVGRGPWLSNRFAIWGIAGYVALAAGALFELTTGRGVAVIAAIPGGLFEIVVGVHLLRRGFGKATSR